MIINEWKAEAACYDSTGLYHHLFFPPGEGHETKIEREEREITAAEVCEGCPVEDDCKAYAARFGMEYGTWGGEIGLKLQRRLRRRKAARLDNWAPTILTVAEDQRRVRNARDQRIRRDRADA